MILTFITILSLTVMGVFLVRYAPYDNEFLKSSGIVMTILGVLSLVIYLPLIHEYISAGYKADIINREYGTNYSRAEVFYADDVIDAIREIDRKRVEIDGNLAIGGDCE